MKFLAQFIIVISLLVILQFIFPHAIHAKDIHPVFKKLLNRLKADGLDERYLQDLFTRPELNLTPEAVAKSLVRREVDLNYAQFLEKYSVDRTISYLKTHKRILKKMENHFSISAPVIVAILSVETSCGRYMGRFETVNILITQTLSLEPEVSRKIYDQIPPDKRLKLDSKDTRERLKKKSVRAYKELKALLTYLKDQNIDPFTVKGSIEGAIGLPQFLPSNIKKYGFDGDGDGKIDLFQHEDAIASIASFLRAHNWREGNKYRRKKEIIRNYNPSDYYASTVLKLAERLTPHWH